MLASKKSRLLFSIPIFKQTICLLIYLALFSNVNVYAAGINIEHVELFKQDEAYNLNAAINFEFGDEVLKALDHGIAIQINTRLLLKENRKWLWDVTVKEIILRYRIEHYPLSGHYLLTDLVSGIQTTYQSFDAIIMRLEKLENIAFFKSNIMTDKNTYTAYMKTQLDIESLPPPLRPLAYFSSHWRLKSPWHKQEVFR